MCSILIVDDDAHVRSAMASWATSLGHHVRQADDADSAMAVLALHPADVAICDVSHPVSDGAWLPSRLHAANPDTAVVVATARADSALALVSLRETAVVDFLSKPVSHSRFREALSRATAANREAVNARRRLAILQQEMTDHLRTIERVVERTPISSDAEVEQFVETLSRERAAVEHSEHVAALSNNIALAMGTRAPELSDIGRAARLHDIGRIAIPPTILCKATKLSDEELAVVRQQPALVAQILERHPFLAAAAPIVGAMFERFDGTGHPLGLRGDEIPRGTRIVAVADALDTMTHYRVYRDPLSMSEALFEIRRGRGTQFDPEAVDALLSVVHLHWTSLTRRSGLADRPLLMPSAGPALPTNRVSWERGCAGAETVDAVSQVPAALADRRMKRLRGWLDGLRASS